ncbi:hypothetical protein D049_0116A, partial [Vibrio parahaemolyticus VPTS-2010]
MSRSKR